MFKEISYLELKQPFSSMEPHHFCNLIRVYHEDHFYEIILNLDQWFRRCPFKDLLSEALEALLFSWGEPFVQFKVEGIMGNIPVKVFKFGPVF